MILCKDILKKTISSVFYILHKIIPWDRLFAFRNAIYSLWISSLFKESGYNYFCYPVQINAPKFIKIGNRNYFCRNTIVECIDKYFEYVYNPILLIGNDCRIGEGTHIGCLNRIELKNGILMGRWCTIIDHNHGKTSAISDIIKPPLYRKLFSKGSIIIEDNVWIGDKVSIIGSVHIGKYSIIAANSVVTKDVPANSVVGGVPAKILKQIKKDL